MVRLCTYSLNSFYHYRLLVGQHVDNAGMAHVVTNTHKLPIIILLNTCILCLFYSSLVTSKSPLSSTDL